MTDRRVVNGIKLPDDSPPTENELKWIEFLRIASNGTDPSPGFAAVQVLQLMFRKEV